MLRVAPCLVAIVGVCAEAAIAADRPATAGRPSLIRAASYGPMLMAPGDAKAGAPVPVRVTLVPEPRRLSPQLVSAPAAPAPDPDLIPGAVPAPEPPDSAPGYEVAESHVVAGPSVTLLYPSVKYHDLHNIHPCAVTIVVAIPHPCRDCGCAYVQICVPPNRQPRIKHKRNEIEYDYGDYEVEIKWRDGVIHVDYDD